ncbi:immunoglobulin-like domain-containing protein [Xylocopilactobacillus apicola]|uniref:DUF5011 domain-containing protein n=1 Tax=Xylocopilactobacillus apicola TaxID=2932184 RepID=A0AAU9D0B2_9LACO|nr:immunoglobulin-like domain-containing protein [Xylocopilactobacillus apicola]BDR59699.1 hypothetical protein XA3_21400 [Xylocopilactobacillus apicola]
MKSKFLNIAGTLLLMATPFTESMVATEASVKAAKSSYSWDYDVDEPELGAYDRLLQNAGPSDGIVDWYPTKNALGAKPSAQTVVKQLIDLSIATNDGTSNARNVLFNNTTGHNPKDGYRETYNKYSVALGFIAQLLAFNGEKPGIGAELEQGAQPGFADPENAKGQSIINGDITKDPSKSGVGRDMADILGTAFFGDPNKAYAQIYVNGYDNVAQSEDNIIHEATTSITLVAQSSLTGRKATAIFKLNNKTVPRGVENTKLNNYVDNSVYANDSEGTDIAGLNLTTAPQEFIDGIGFSHQPTFWIDGNDGGGTIVVPRGTTAKQIAELIAKKKVAGSNTLQESAPMKAVQGAAIPDTAEGNKVIVGSDGNKTLGQASYSHFYEATQNTLDGVNTIGVPWANGDGGSGSIYNNSAQVHSGIDGPENFHFGNTGGHNYDSQKWSNKTTAQYREYNNVFNTNLGGEDSQSVNNHGGTGVYPIRLTDSNHPTKDGWFGGGGHSLDTNSLFNGGNWSTKSAASIPDVRISEGTPDSEDNSLTPARNMKSPSVKQVSKVAGVSDPKSTTNVGKVKHLFKPSSYFKEAYDANHFVTNSPESQNTDVDAIAKEISDNGSFTDGQIKKSFSYQAPVSSWIYKSYDNPYSTVMSSAGAQTIDGEALESDRSNSTIQPQAVLDLDDPNNPDATLDSPSPTKIALTPGQGFVSQPITSLNGSGASWTPTYFYAATYKKQRNEANAPTEDFNSKFTIKDGNDIRGNFVITAGDKGTLVKYGAVGTDGEDNKNEETKSEPKGYGSPAAYFTPANMPNNGLGYTMNRQNDYPFSQTDDSRLVNNLSVPYRGVEIWDDSQYFVQTWDKNTTVKEKKGGSYVDTSNSKPLIYNSNHTLDASSIGKVDSPNFEAKYYLAGFIQRYSGGSNVVPFYTLGEHIAQTAASKRAYFNSNLYNNPKGSFSNNGSNKNNSRLFVSQDFAIGPVSSDMIASPGGNDLSIDGTTYPSENNSEDDAAKILELVVKHNDPTQNRANDVSKSEFTDGHGYSTDRNHKGDGNGFGQDGSGYKLVSIADAAAKQGISENELANEIAKVTNKSTSWIKSIKWVEATLPRIKRNAGKARINVVVYDRSTEDSTAVDHSKPKTKPSFSTTDIATGNDPFNVQLSPYTTTYDDGAVLKAGDVPDSFKNQISSTLVAGNPDLVDSQGQVAQNRLKQLLVTAFLNSWQQNAQSANTSSQIYLYGGFGISDSDTKNSYSQWPSGFKTNTGNYLTATTKFPQDFYRGGSDLTLADGKSKIKGIPMSALNVDVSEIDATKPGTYPAVFTYTSPDSKATAKITVPIKINSSSAPVFSFQGLDSMTLHVGDHFNPNDFKVVGSWEIFHQYKGNYDQIVNYEGIARDAEGKPKVTIQGTVDTNRPGIYQLTYEAINLSGQKTSMVRNITVLPKGDTSDWQITESPSTGYINYVPGYGINVWDAPGGSFTGQRLAHGTAWKIFQKASNSNGKTFYNVGKNQWIDSQYVSFTPVSGLETLDGVVTIKYVPGYGVNLWKNPNTTGGYYEDRKLMDGTEWRTFGKQNGFYKVGNNQWIQGDFVNFKVH